MSKPPQPRIDERELAWARANRPLLRAFAHGNAILYWTMAAAFILGFAAYILSDQIKIGAIFLPEGWRVDLVSDIVYNLGIALWTGVVISLFLEVLPAIQRRMARRYLREIGNAAPIAETNEEDEDGEDAEALLERVLAQLALIDTRLASVDALHAEITALKAAVSKE